MTFECLRHYTHPLDKGLFEAQYQKTTAASAGGAETDSKNPHVFSLPLSRERAKRQEKREQRQIRLGFLHDAYHVPRSAR